MNTQGFEREQRTVLWYLSHIDERTDDDRGFREDLFVSFRLATYRAYEWWLVQEGAENSKKGQKLKC